MRDLSSSCLAGSSYCDEPCTHLSPKQREGGSAIHTITHNPAGPRVSTKRTYSQKNRSKTMLENARQAMGFIDKQHSAIKDLIKQLQIFNGYCEQLSSEDFITCSSHAWSVYLMHAQALQSGVNQCFMGKRLFGDGAQPPIRLHLEEDGRVNSFDLPDPCFLAMPSIQSFMAGVSQQRLPSLLLINSCIAELLNALIDVQKCKANLSRIITKLASAKTQSLHSLTQSSVIQLHSDPGWFGKIKKIFNSKSFFLRGRPLSA